MAIQSKHLRAAQYVRMSTEHQQYSTANQRQAIGDYASVRGIEIVATYEDLGKSGLTLAGRPALSKLLADVVSGQTLFDTVLVYDVSRWGRFQDADESAHLEYLCRLAGVSVEYCAEPFANDGSPFSSICKVVKRALAAEYSRELSTKVYLGKRRLGELGFRQGGSPGYGLRRCLVDAAGARKHLLQRGERKSIATDRIILVPGPSDEIAVVQRIYRDYAQRGLGTRAIVSALNREGIPSESGRQWSEAVLRRVLTSEKYVGDSVWGRVSCKLRTPSRPNDPSTWVRHRGAFAGIVDRKLFEKAQRIRAKRARHVSDDEIVQHLRRIYAKHGTISTALIAADGFFGTCAIRKRFGSLLRAYARVGYRPSRDLAFLSLDAAARRLRASTAEAVSKAIVENGGSIERRRGACRFLINGEIIASITVAQQRRSQRKNPRWYIKQGGTDDDLTVAVLMDGSHERALAYYFFPAAVLGNGLLLAPINPIQVDAFRSQDLTPLIRLCARSDPAAEALRASVPRGPKPRSSKGPAKAGFAKLTFPGARSVAPTSLAGSFLRTTTELRHATLTADASRTLVAGLRGILLELFVDARFVQVLALDGMKTVPSPAFRSEAEIDERIRTSQEVLRERAIALLSQNGLSQQATPVLERLVPERRIEAVELMILAGDLTQYHARALVAATPEDMLMERPNKHIYGPTERELKVMIAVSATTYREAKHSLARFGDDALDEVVLEAFVRRLMAGPFVAAWLERHHKRAVRAFKTALLLREAAAQVAQ
jgi:DNA invertase Pin-like site-specific DNA recombinase